MELLENVALRVLDALNNIVATDERGKNVNSKDDAPYSMVATEALEKDALRVEDA